MPAASEVIGFFASALVLATFAMKEMCLLRTTAIFSNIAFIVYGAVNGLLPVVTLHVLLLPLNIHRLMGVDRAKQNGIAPPPAATNKATQMAIEALYLADALREQQRRVGSDRHQMLSPPLLAPDQP